MAEGNRKLNSFKWTVCAVLFALVAYFIICAVLKTPVDSNVIMVALAMIGGDGMVFKGANAAEHKAKAMSKGADSA